MEKLDAENDIKIALSNTSNFLHEFNNKKTFEIDSQYPTLNGSSCEIKKGNRCYKFSTGRIISKGPPAKYQSKSYGLSDNFNLINANYHVVIPNGAGRITIRNNFEPFGELWELKTKNFDNEGYHRAILPLSDFNDKPVEYIKSEPFKTLGSVRVAGFINISTDDYSIGIFDYSINEEDCLIIEVHKKIDYQHFIDIVNAIIYSFGLISGSLIRSEVYYIQYQSSSLDTVQNLCYQRLKGALEGLPAINPRRLSLTTEMTGDESKLPKKDFQNLIQGCLADKRLIRAIRIITESANYPPEIKASTFSVALETLRDIIIQQNKDQVNPFKNKRVASKTIKQLREVVNKIEDQKFNNKKSILDRLTQLNQPSNTKSFFKSFELLDIKLNSDDEECLRKRNDFLHGRIPYQGENKDIVLHHIVYKLHLLLSALILKHVGYNGYLFNNLKFSYLRNFEIELNEPLFRKMH